MKYDVILADPPWSFEAWDDNIGPNGRTPAKHYKVMKPDELATLQIKTITADNCVLFLWCVWPSLYSAVPIVLDGWGFTYRTIGWVWVKANPTGFGHFMGLGYYTRANTEPCLIAVKGEMPVATKDVLALIYSPVREHSRKPDEQYNKIERLYPNKRYLELFARHKRDGWTSLGDGIDGNDITQELHRLGMAK